MNDTEEKELKAHIDEKATEMLEKLSDELKSIFGGVYTNDMKCWGSAL